jgi:hypothetical protein
MPDCVWCLACTLAGHERRRIAEDEVRGMSPAAMLARQRKLNAEATK